MQGINQGGNQPAPNAVAKSGRNVKAPVKRYPRSFWWYLKMFFITLQIVVFCAIVVSISVGYGIYQRLSEIVPDVHFITQRTRAEATRVWSAPDATTHKRTLLATFKGEQRIWLPIEKLKLQRKIGKKIVPTPGRLIAATLAIEDARFYSHPGMDVKRIAKAAFVNFTSGDSTSQGGSTITEQLAKNIYFKRNKTLSQRLQTALLALQLERRFTKDEILELYLNEIFYGNHADGCEAASRLYFNKSASNLSISEAAFLAGLPNSPSNFDPFVHFDRAKTRQRIVLHEMLKKNFINLTQWVDAKKDASVERQIKQSKIRTASSRLNKEHWKAPYFVSYVRSYLKKQYAWSDDYINTAGLTINTTLDMKLQAIADRRMKQGLAETGSKTLQGALVCIDPWTGHVEAIVGGRGYYNGKKTDEFNRAVMAKRQPGSSMKPYLYAAAMEAGMTPDSTEEDAPFKIWHKQIRNYTRGYAGWMTLREAIGKSNNVIAVKTMKKLGGGNIEAGIQAVVQKAHLMGIESALVPVPTLALGSSEITPLEHTSAFGVFATRGMRAEETPIESVIGATGEMLVEHQHPVNGARVLSEEAGNKMWDMLHYVVMNGTGKRAQFGGRDDIIGKTGTTSDNKDVWFMGATRQLACGVWMGYDRQRDLGGDSAGGAWCAPVWRSFMQDALVEWQKRNPVERMIENARMTDQRRTQALQKTKYVNLRVCNESGKLANAGCPSTTMVQFSAGSGMPTEHCDIPAHQTRVQTIRALDTQPSRNDAAQPGDLGFGSDGTSSDEPARRDDSFDRGGASDARDKNTSAATRSDGATDGPISEDRSDVFPDDKAESTPADNAPTDASSNDVATDNSDDAPVRRR